MTVEGDLERAFELFDKHRDELRLVGPPQSEVIDEAENALGAAFPPSYRAFVARQGAGSIRGREVYGVLDDVHAKGPPNVVWRTMDARTSTHLPDRYVIVVDFDDSSSAALDLSHQNSTGECPVVRIWPGEAESDLVDSQLADNFGSFILRFTEERLTF
jgi:hypothetical protein